MLLGESVSAHIKVNTITLLQPKGTGTKNINMKIIIIYMNKGSHIALYDFASYDFAPPFIPAYFKFHDISTKSFSQ